MHIEGTKKERKKERRKTNIRNEKVDRQTERKK